MRINTNILFQEAQKFSRWNEISTRQSIERLSSGRRINCGGDDPSGLGISKGMTALRHGIETANMNIQDAISFLQIRDAAVAESQELLLRIRDLALRAANEAVLTTADREKLSLEATKLVSELYRINETTKFNERKVFRPVFETVPGGVDGVLEHSGVLEFSINLQDFVNENGVVEITATWFDGWVDFPDLNFISPDGTEAFGYLYDTWQNPDTVEAYVGGQFSETVDRGDLANNEGSGTVPAGATMDSADQVDYTGWGGVLNEETFTFTNPATGLWKMIIDNQDPAAHKYGIFINEPGMLPVEDNRVQIGPYNEEGIDNFRINLYEVDPIALKLMVDFNSGEKARETVDSIDTAMEFVSDRRKYDGIVINNLQHTIDDNNIHLINMAAGNSRIEDADMAAEIVEFTKAQIISQTGMSAMAHTSAINFLIGELIDEVVA
ncbi:MAG: flagellin [bacterium]